jgi:hypothetical protein
MLCRAITFGQHWMVWRGIFQSHVPKQGGWSIASSDVVAFVLLLVGAAFFAAVLQSQLAFTNTHLDVWFDSDSQFIVDQLTHRWSTHNGTNSRHPIYVLLTYPLVFVQVRLLGIDTAHAMLAVLILYSSLCVAMMYVVLRLMDLSIVPSLLFTGIFVVSAPGILFLGIHERLILGGLTILVMVAVFLLYQRHLVPAGMLMLAAAFTLGVTVTNFMIGVLGLLLVLGIRRGVQASANALVVVMLLNVLVVVAFPTSTTLLDVRSWPFLSTVVSGRAERVEKGGNLWERARAFFFYSVVLPEPQIQKKPEGSDTRYLSVQEAGIEKGDEIWYVAAVLWVVLLAMGARSLMISRRWNTLAKLLGLGVLGQFCLFMLYGAETVLFSPYYVPLMILIAAMSWRTCATRRAALVLTLLFLIVLVFNNTEEFIEALQKAKNLISTPEAAARTLVLTPGTQ